MPPMRSDECLAVIHLIIADSEQSMNLSQVLSDKGYRVIAISDLSEYQAISAAETSKLPVAIIVDNSFFSDQHNCTIQQLLGYRGQSTSPPLLGLLEHDDLISRLTAFRCGIKHSLVKPVNNKTLFELLAKLTAPYSQLPYSQLPCRVLLIGDDQKVLNNQASILSPQDFEVQTQTQIKNLFTLMDEFCPDIVIVNSGLSNITELEITALLRERAQQEIAVLLISSRTQDLSLRFEPAIDDVLIAPFQTVEFVTAVTTCIEKIKPINDLQRSLNNDTNEQALINSAINQHAIVSITDQAGNIIYMNDLFCEISGYKREELIGKNHRLIKSGSHSAEFYKQMWQTISKGSVWQGEICNRKKDGSLYWVKSTITPFLDNSGKPYQYVSVRTDITERKHYELVTHNQAERLRRSQNFANIGTWDWDIQTGDLYWSERIPRLFGYSDNEIETSYANFLSSLHPDDKENVVNAINSCIEHGTDYDIEHRIIRPDGQVRWLHEKGDVVRNEAGQPLHMLGVVIDINERKQLEQERNESEEKYRCLFELSEDPMWMILEDQIVLANKSAAQALGFDSPDALVHLHLYQLSPKTQSDGKSSFDKHNEMLVFAYLTGYHRFEWAYLNTDGKEVPAEVSLTRVPFDGQDGLFCIWRDITERKKAEQALKESQTQLLEAQQMAHIGSWKINFLTRKLVWSDEIYRIYGYQPNEIKPSAKGFRKAVHPDDLEIVLETEKLAKKNGHHDIIHRIIRPDGSIRHVHELAHGDFDKTGKLIGLTGTIQDITERIEADTKLRETEDRFSLAVESSGDGIWDWNLETDTLLYSKNYMHMLGYEENELPNHINSKISSIHPDDRDSAQQILHSYLDGVIENYSQELRLRCKDGSYKWILCRGKVINRDHEGKPLRMIGIHSDISKRKSVELKLAQQQKLLSILNQSFTQFMSAGMLHNTIGQILSNIVKLTDSEYGFFSEVYYEESNTPQLKSLTTKNIIPPEYPNQPEKIDIRKIKLPALNELLNQAIKAKNHVISNQNTSFQHADDTDKNLTNSSFLIVPVFYGSQMVGIYGLSKQNNGYSSEIVSFLRPFNIAYGVMIQDEYNRKALIEAKVIAEKANQAKSEFLSSMSHELRTPLNAIMGFSQLMEYDNNLSEEHNDCVKEIIKAGKHLLTLIDEILDLAKIETGHLNLSVSTFHLSPLITECLNLVKPMAESNQVQMSHNEIQNISLHTDPTRLKQILLNLLSNAIKYNRPHGTVNLEMQLPESTRLRISIRDTGVGIDNDSLNAIFTPFNRLGHENGHIEGTGIGLTFTKRAIEIMGGSIGVESEPNVGSCFWIELPITLT